MPVQDYSPVPGANTTISGIDIAEGCAASNINDAFRQLMADVANLFIGGYLEPAGTIKGYAGASAPTGYLICDGSPVSRATYDKLFAAVGTAWGAGDGSTTFNLPDFRGRTIIGAGSAVGLTARTLAASGGEEAHVLSSGEAPALTVSGSASVSGNTGAGTAHNHGVNDPGHTHNYTSGYSGAGFAANVSGGSPAPGTTLSTASATTGITTANESAHTHAFSATGTISGTTNGGGSAHNNMQPFAVANVIIKT